MKKILNLGLLVLVFILVGCGAKKETATFTQTPMEGTDTSIVVEHEGDKVTKVSAKVVFDNKKLNITDESTADQVAKAFESSSNLANATVKYSEKETTITYDAPDTYVKSGGSYKDAEKSLTSAGFKQK